MPDTEVSEHAAVADNELAEALKQRGSNVRNLATACGKLRWTNDVHDCGTRAKRAHTGGHTRSQSDSWYELSGSRYDDTSWLDGLEAPDGAIVDEPEMCVKNLVFGDSEGTLSKILAGVSQDSLGTNGTAVVSLFAVVCRLFSDRSVSEITHFVAQVRSEHPGEAPNFTRAGQALIRYVLGEAVFETALLTVLSPVELVRIAGRLLVAAVRLGNIDKAEFRALLSQASEISQGFTLSSAPAEMLQAVSGEIS